MNVVILSTNDFKGGAARAAYRLHQGLRKAGVHSQMLVQTKISDDKSVIGPQSKLEKGLAKLRPSLEKLPLEFYQKRDRLPYSIQWFPDKVAKKLNQTAPEIINLHWVNHGYLQIETIAKLKKTVVWTLHDMWAFTGGCHYSQECDRYTSTCGSCPQLHSTRDWDLSRWVWDRKAKAWKDVNLTVVTPSAWLATCARESSLFQELRVEHIPNGLDTQRYKPLDRLLAKKWLGLPPDKLTVLFGAVNATSDRRKGFYLLQSALQKLSYSANQEQVELVVFGASQSSETVSFGFKTHYFGELSDDISLALLYAAADVFIAPSIQDNLPNTVMEALACGTPCVAFKIGGMPELIEHQQNGYLAHPFAVEDLAAGIAWVLEDAERHQKLGDRSRVKAEREFNQEIQAQRYKALFCELQEKRHN